MLNGQNTIILFINEYNLLLKCIEYNLKDGRECHEFILCNF